MLRLNAPPIFSALGDYQNAGDQMDYVEKTLIDKARDGTLYLTDLFNPPNRQAMHYVGLIISSSDVSGEGRITPGTRQLDHELASYQVELEAMVGNVPEYDPRDGKTVTGHRKVQHKIGYKSGRQRVIGTTGKGVKQHEMIVEYPLKDAKSGKLPLPVAWQILSQCGENCSSSIPRTQCTQWRVREVKPGKKAKN